MLITEFNVPAVSVASIIPLVPGGSSDRLSSEQRLVRLLGRSREAGEKRKEEDAHPARLHSTLHPGSGLTLSGCSPGVSPSVRIAWRCFAAVNFEAEAAAICLLM